jgi:hypothetical protein
MRSLKRQRNVSFTAWVILDELNHVCVEWLFASRREAMQRKPEWEMASTPLSGAPGCGSPSITT